MKDAVLDPALFFISETDWVNDNIRDCFIRHLLDNLTIVDSYSIAQILWNDELENCLWSHPQIPPWRSDKDWGNALIPIIYHLFQRNRKYVNYCDSDATCIVSPTLDCCNPSALLCFLKLMHYIIGVNSNVILCLGLLNVSSSHNQYKFGCDCCSKSIIPELIHFPTEWLYHIDIENELWPHSIEEHNAFRKALEVVRIRDFNKDFLYSVDYTDRFIDDIVHVTDNRLRILQQLTKRLTLTRQQAMQDATLQDEYLSKSNEYRFRVTQRPSSTRIHYIYNQSGDIILLKYYGIGQHDAGL